MGTQSANIDFFLITWQKKEKEMMLDAVLMYSRSSLLAQLQEIKNLAKIPLLLLDC